MTDEDADEKGRERLVDWLRRERDAHVSGGLYQVTQIRFAFNSNHMEGSTLTPEQTAQLYNTGTLLAEAGEPVRADDVVEAVNHFRAFDWMLDHVDDAVDEHLVCALHAMLKRGTRQENDPRYHVGAYKTLPNVIGAGLSDTATVLPADVPHAMGHVFGLYAQLHDDPFGIACAHWMFETTHPFSDGNGRVGRLVMFKELLRINAMPLIVRDEDRALYVRGLSEFSSQPGYLIDTLLYERDYYRSLVTRFTQNQVRCTYNDHWSRAQVESVASSGGITNPFVRKDHMGEHRGGERCHADADILPARKHRRHRL